MTVNSERDTLLYFLEAQRVAVLGIIEGLDEHQLQRQIVPSGWTPIGLIGHLAGAEWY